MGVGEGRGADGWLTGGDDLRGTARRQQVGHSHSHSLARPLAPPAPPAKAAGMGAGKALPPHPSRSETHHFGSGWPRAPEQSSSRAARRRRGEKERKQDSRIRFSQERGPQGPRAQIGVAGSWRGDRDRTLRESFPMFSKTIYDMPTAPPPGARARCACARWRMGSDPNCSGDVRRNRWLVVRPQWRKEG